MIRKQILNANSNKLEVIDRHLVQLIQPRRLPALLIENFQFLNLIIYFKLK